MTSSLFFFRFLQILVQEKIINIIMKTKLIKKFKIEYLKATNFKYFIELHVVVVEAVEK